MDAARIAVKSTDNFFLIMFPPCVECVVYVLHVLGQLVTWKLKSADPVNADSVVVVLEKQLLFSKHKPLHPAVMIQIADYLSRRSAVQKQVI